MIYSAFPWVRAVVDSCATELNDGLEYLQNRRVQLFGYSQGAFMVLGMLNQIPREVPIEAIGLVEIPQRDNGSLIGGFVLDGMHVGPYYRENRHDYPDTSILHRALNSVIELGRRFATEPRLKVGLRAMNRISPRAELEIAINQGQLEVGDNSLYIARAGRSFSGERVHSELTDWATAKMFPLTMPLRTYTGERHCCQESATRYTSMLSDFMKRTA